MPLYSHFSTTVVSCGKSVARKLLQQKLEHVQKYGMRLILSKLPRTPIEDLRRMLKWLPLTTRRELFRAALVHRCVHKQAPGYLSGIQERINLCALVAYLALTLKLHPIAQEVKTTSICTE